jgi:DNA-binding CsgD family transcriptional regulator
MLAGATLSALAGVPVAEPAQAVPDALVERDAEIEQLLGSVVALVSGRSGLVTVTGRRGAGLSALLELAVAEAKALGLPAALARCSRAESGIRYGVVSQAAAGLAGAGCADPLRLSHNGDFPAAAVIPRLCGEFVALARRTPLLIAVDDAHWADRGSREWLAAMARRLRHAPILLIQSVADPADPADVTEASQVIEVRPLGARGIRRVITSSCAGRVDRSFAAEAAAATQGSPAVLRAALDRFAQACLPASADNAPVFAARAAEVVGERVADAVASLPHDALALVRAMAVGGDALDLDLICSLADPGVPPAPAALTALARLGLAVAVDTGAPRLAGPIVAEKVLAGMNADERRALARRAAELGRRAAIAEDELATLLSNAPPLGAGWAAGVLSRVAARRRADGDHEAAAALLARALREPLDGEGRRRLLVELGMAEVGLRPQAADRRLHQVLLDADLAGPASVQAADLLWCRGDAPAAHRVIATAYGRSRADAAKAAPLAAIGWLVENDCAAEPVLPAPSFSGVMEQAAAPEQPDRPTDRAQAGVAAWMLTLRGTRMARARELARLALEPSAGGRGPFGPRIHACRTLACTEDAAEAVLGLDEVLEDARRAGARAAAALALLHRGWCELRRGNPSRASGDLDRARAELPAASWHPRLLPGFVALEAGLHLARESVDRAQRALARELPAGADQGVYWAYLLFFRGAVSLALADPETASRLFGECGRILLARRWTNPALSPWRSLAGAAHAARGDAALAHRLTREAVERAGEWGAPGALGEARLWAARVGGADPDDSADSAADDESGLVRLGHVGGADDVADGLSADERRIAVLAAGGRSNSEIARVLATSIRTVELRLTAVYRKLALTSRGQLASRLHVPTTGN